MAGSFGCVILIRRSIHGSSSGKFLKIGSIQVPIRNAKCQELVPQGYATSNLITREIGNLKWLIQKEILKQDVYLIGPPDESRSLLALAYCELTNREVEWLTITRDTTETEIKQRREIRNSNAYYTDCAAVRAAIEGRVLIIDGVEKAERNVLPILNNLLENREMQLDDGRFLMAASKYDRLLEKYGKSELANFERVDEQFSVIALGLPIPNYKGHPLDPPLRSRFQSINIGYLPFGIAKQLCESLSPNVDRSKLEKLICLAYGINSQHGNDALNLTRVPIDNLVRAIGIWNLNPHLSEAEVFELVYPHKSILRIETEQSAFDSFLENFKIQRQKSSISTIKSVDHQTDGIANVTLDYGGKSVQLTTRCGNENKHSHLHNFVSTNAFETFLSQLALTHSVGDFCILGERGSGKTTVINEFAKRFGYSTETIALYNDLNSRDLLQSRRILENGDTVWENGQLIDCLKNGKLAILDNLEQAHWSTIEVLKTLIHHRFLQLPNGERWISPISFNMLMTKMNCTAEELNQRGVYKISPNFRLVALGDAESANATGPTAKWLNDQMLNLFIYHTLPTMNLDEELTLITKLIPDLDKKTATKLIAFVDKLSSSHDSKLRNLSISLSLRRKIQILKSHSVDKNESIYDAVQRTTLSRFLPTTTRDSLIKLLKDFNIVPNKMEISIDKKNLDRQLASISRDEVSLEHESLIPETVFFDNAQHLKNINQMAKDYKLGNHLLLIGNQGVGKNKLTDRFLQTIKHPRQYIQLHRDTTIQSLTIRSTVEEGRLRYEDSPLIKAVRDGQDLVIDEADKAPLHVIAVLKSLLDSGFLYLSDGRRIQPAELDPLPNGKSIAIHPDFRIIMLANRPGFPFLGNDLYGTLGDLFSVHIIDNPDPDSELVMLKQYGPNVNKRTIERLIDAFNRLRELSNDGQIQYPFSTRELVAIIKHLEKFPDTPVGQAVRNVFDFDSYSNDTLKVIDEVFKEHKIHIEMEVYTTKERLEIMGGDDFDLSKLGDPKYGKVDPNNAPHSGGNTWAGGTGGYNTAGLGGVGGPFRLDAGHDVTQISELAKQQVPEEVRKKARAIAQQEYAKRLKEIEMSEYDANVYKQFYDKVSRQVGLLKNVVDSLEAREKERRWAKHQTSGDLDDNKLIEGMAGEKAIYRKRVELDPEAGTVQKKPKLLTLLVDVSGSMYRFNGYDQRLHRSLETVLLVMESLSGKKEKIKYNLVGHSGETFEANFSSFDKPPKNEKERLDLLKKMMLHSQFCMSGDYTLEAIEVATKKLSKEENADERFLITLSDANLDRYGIAPKHLANLLTLEKNVNSYIILIGSLGPQAERLRQALPAGKAFVVQNTSELPRIFGEIFTSSLIQ